MANLRENGGLIGVVVKQESLHGKYEVKPYDPEDAITIYKELEVPNWAPWLRASTETLAKRAKVFPEGQLAVWEGKRPIANISLARFNYDGNPDNLPTWDELMGVPATGEHTFDLHGNALGMMSINVHPDYQGKGLTKVVIDAVKCRIANLGVTHIMGSFRPSQFGEYSTQNPKASIKEYIDKKRKEDNMPHDPWLRALTRNGMRMLRIDDAAMVVTDVSKEQFDEWQRIYNPEKWKQIAPSVWRCGETGVWLVGPQNATYVESNVWGILDQNGTS